MLIDFLFFTEVDDDGDNNDDVYSETHQMARNNASELRALCDDDDNISAVC